MLNNKKNKPIKQNDVGLANASKTKKISFFSAILIVMGSSIGAGIFFKSGSVLNSVQGSLVLAIFSWIIAAFSVIAMGLALVEISSARNDNLSIIGWVKTFNSRATFKASKNFMFYIYLPLTYFFMPLYAIMSFQDGLGALTGNSSFGTSVDWLIWTVISLGISIYFILMSGLSTKMGNIQNKFVTYIKFIPLAFVGVIGFVIVGIIGANPSAGPVWPSPEVAPGISIDPLSSGKTIQSFMPGFGVMLGMAAIFFAYDGFYVAAGIQSDMEEPKKTPLAILLGLLATTVIYLILAISMSINGGSFFGMGDLMVEAFGADTGKILFGVTNILIAIGVLGIINGFSMWAPRFTEDLIKEGELPFSQRFKNKINPEKPKVGIMYSLIISLSITILFTLIGALGYSDTAGYGESYGTGMGKLYSFADLMGTWTALFAFGFIAFSIYGGIKNRKTKAVKTSEKKYFLWSAYISVVLVITPLAVTLLLPIIDLMLLSQVSETYINSINAQITAYNNSLPIDQIQLSLLTDYSEIVLSRVMLVVTLAIFIFLSYGLVPIENYFNAKKHGSIQNYEKWQKEIFIVS